MNNDEIRQILREVQLAGNCSNPVRVSSELVDLQTGEVATRSLRLSCKDRRVVICPACSSIYQKDAWILVSAGLIGGKGVNETVSTHPRLFVTLTAPSFGNVHTTKSNGTCQPHRRPSHCAHQRSRTCHQHHSATDPLLGRPICFECFDYVGAVLWNAHASHLWNNTVQLLRRSMARAGGVSIRGFSEVGQVHYLKVAEMQRRGLIHFHVIIRADGPRDAPSDLAPWLNAEVLARTMKEAIGQVAATRRDGLTIKWGAVFDIQILATEVHGAGKVASYVAKYATKTTDGSLELAREFKARRQIERLIDDPHRRQLALTSWDLGGEETWSALRLQSHAHVFGFTGQLLTKSRDFSTTFAALRKVRATHMSAGNTVAVIEGSAHYVGRGYDDPRATTLAELFASMSSELRSEAAERRRASSKEGLVNSSPYQLHNESQQNASESNGEV